jgi:hypothetical protein
MQIISTLRYTFGCILVASSWWSTSGRGWADELLSYDRDIRPILSENCFACHGFDEHSREAGLRLDTREGAVDEGGAIEPGLPDSSLLMERILSTDADELMPPARSGKSLSDEQKAILRRWIEQGAEYEKHWAFAPPQRRPIPAVDGVDHPLDRFVQSRLKESGIVPSPLASPSTLIRRLSLDLIGLPPTPGEVSDFEQAAAIDPAGAYAELVERLLASSHFGERWGRWWLDQARYADSHGYSIDGEREIWKYRDWVIAALNADKGFDEFTIEQLAGDLLPNATVEQKIATGFHRNTQINQEGGVDPEQFRIDSVFDRVATTGNVWLGLSIGCAQCHDHKFDPISQEEYYRMFAFLNNQREPSLKVYPADVAESAEVAVDDSQPNLQPAHATDQAASQADSASQVQVGLQDGLIDERQLLDRKLAVEKSINAILDSYVAPLKEWESQLDETSRSALPEPLQAALKVGADKRTVDAQASLLVGSGLLAASGSERELVELKQRIEQHAQVVAELARGVSTLVLEELTERRPTHLFIKGDFTRPDAEVFPGTPAVLHPLTSSQPIPNRLDLAKWLVDEANPLTARVIANRVWQQLFGRGIVETESDFGYQGSVPSHPELLDWLALELRDNRWSLKELLRKIVTSHTYQQSSHIREDLVAVDPLNLLLGRQNRLRLDAEVIRDVALVASGLFSPKLGGPPVYPPIPEGVMTQGQVKRTWNTSKGEDRYRRGLYTFVYRVTPPPALNVFDAPDGLSSCTRRIRSNTPLQALALLNDPAFVEFAVALEKRIVSEGLPVAFRLCTSREPAEDELRLIEQLNTLNQARALLNLDETITRE